ncbi:hypothetical protein [Endozoicomonas sp. ONNA2]|uniref:hypothetical protein n=1 Tax=Endozoicomonas sp. ONNA2 TaxID=2828741 RepID=UPI002148EBBB|nr:hypothetical protein [Endozoicomonas sp. ONNA2]
MIIVFSGSDGSGKSTQIKLLQSFLSRKQLSIKYLWARGGYTPVFLFLKMILRKLFGKKLPEASDSKERERLFRKGSVSSLWMAVAIFDLIIYYGLYARFNLLLGRVVICDRYIEDTKLDFKRNFGDTFNPGSFMWRVLILIAPKPNKSFLLYVPVDVSLERSKLKNEPFPDSPETLKWRLKYYLDEKHFPSEQFFKIDCQQPVEVIQTIIRNHIEAA